MDEEKIRRLVKKMVEISVEIEKELSVPEISEKKDSSVDFLKWYAAQYEQKIGTPYIVSWAKEGALIKQALKSLSFDQLKGRAESFLDSNDPFILKAGKTISVFFSMLNKLGPAKKTGLEGFLIS